MNIISTMVHNGTILNQAQETLNSFLGKEGSNIHFEDEEGNIFTPKGKIKIWHIDLITIIKNN